MHVPLWSTVVLDVRCVGLSARARKAVYPLPVPFTPRPTYRWKALLEHYELDRLFTSQIPAVLELWLGEGQTPSIFLALERAAQHVAAAELHHGCHCPRAAVCTSALLNLRESNSAHR